MRASNRIYIHHFEASFESEKSRNCPAILGPIGVSLECFDQVPRGTL